MRFSQNIERNHSLFSVFPTTKVDDYRDTKGFYQTNTWIVRLTKSRNL